MNPSISLTPFTLPLNTHRATTVNELFDVLFDSGGYSFDYRVGEKFNTSVRLRIRNNTVNSALKITIAPPSFVIIDSSNFVLAAKEIKDLILSVNELEFLNGSFKKGPLQDNVIVTVIPEELTEVPLIPNDLSSLTL